MSLLGFQWNAWSIYQTPLIWWNSNSRLFIVIDSCWNLCLVLSGHFSSVLGVSSHTDIVRGQPCIRGEYRQIWGFSTVWLPLSREFPPLLISKHSGRFKPSPLILWASNIFIFCLSCICFVPFGLWDIFRGKDR